MTHTILEVINNWGQNKDDGLFVPEHQYEVGMYVPNANGAAGEYCWHAIARYDTAVSAARLVHYLNGGISSVPDNEMIKGLL
jgi:hypothetical protein